VSAYTRTSPAPMVGGPAVLPAAGPPVTVGELPQEVDLVLYRGDDFYLTVTVTAAAGGPFDLTGYVPTAQIRETPDDADPPLAAFTATVAANVITLHLTHTAAAALTVDPAVWDVQIADPLGGITTLARGSVTVTLDVTRP
jgi:hypothetical protein